MHPPSTPFRAIERVFRRGNGVLTEGCAISKGALDFHGNPPSNAPSYPPLKRPTSKLAPPPFETGAMYGLHSHPGFYILPGALSPTFQLSLFRACLRYYIESPQCQRSVKGKVGEEGVSLWQSSVRQGIEVPSPLHTLAWATLGVHFDWKARRYPTRGSESGGGGQPFPPILGGILQGLAESIEGRVVGAAHAPLGRSPLHPFHPHSAIVSLYHPSRSKERLPIAGHRDDAPGEDLSTPVVSLSLGATAVFLLGGKTKECSPTPLLLRSGDVMVLSGQSRACVHGVPRVLFPSSTSDAREGQRVEGRDAAVSTRGDTSTNLILPQLAGLRNEEEEKEERRAYFPGEEEEERAFLHFLTQARINITARSIMNHC